MEERKTDVRVIDLFKAIDRSLMTPDQFEDAEEIYTCLGHFEVFRVRSLCLGKGSIFADIWKDSCLAGNNSRSYVYPLYLLRDGAPGEMDSFWQEKAPCMLISRVHCDLPDQEDDFGGVLEAYIRSFGSGTDRPLEVQVDGTRVCYALYQTLELGDTAVLLKSISLSACLKIAEHLMAQPIVGNVYSYCGLHKQLFNREPELLGQGFTEDEALVREALERKLPQVSMRFVVHSLLYARQTWDSLGFGEQVRYVTGTADAIVDLSDSSTLCLIRILEELWKPHTVKYQAEDGEKTADYLCGDAFDDIITRSGVAFSTNVKLIPPERRTFDAAGQDELLEKFKRIENSLSPEQYNWLYALQVQMKTLLIMMNNCVMDDLSLLIWPSIKAFIRRLYDIVCVQKRSLSRENDKEIRQFLDGWATLSNDIVHLESQLMQNPKLQAPRVRVPAALLAFYMAFVDKLNHTLLEIDVESRPESITRQYHPLIAHEIGPRPNTLCVLDSSREQDPANRMDCPLLVSLPISLMYCPAEMTAVLCHELMHYAGESCRMREERYKRVLATCAGIILNKWLLDGRCAGSLLLSDMLYAVQKLQKQLDERLRCRCVVPILYIQDMKFTLPEVLEEVYCDWHLQAQLLTHCADPESLHSQFPNYVRAFTPAKRGADIQEMQKRLDELLLIYRECYADVAAVIFLEMDEKLYLKNIYEREVENTHKSGEAGRNLQMLATRAAAVIFTVWPESDCQWGKDSDWKAFVATFTRQMRDMVDLWVEQDGKEECLQTVGEYVPLTLYLSKCVERLRELSKTNQAQELKKLYLLISDQDVSLAGFRRVITNYHRSIDQT